MGGLDMDRELLQTYDSWIAVAELRYARRRGKGVAFVMEYLRYWYPHLADSERRTIIHDTYLDLDVDAAVPSVNSRGDKHGRSTQDIQP